MQNRGIILYEARDIIPDINAKPKAQKEGDIILVH